MFWLLIVVLNGGPTNATKSCLDGAYHLISTAEHNRFSDNAQYNTDRSVALCLWVPPAGLMWMPCERFAPTVSKFCVILSFENSNARGDFDTKAASKIDQTWRFLTQRR